MNNNPAYNVYILFGPSLLVGALFVKNEFIIGFVFLAIVFLSLQYMPYYRLVRQNRDLMRALMVYIPTCVVTGVLEYFGLISFGINYAIFLLLLIIYFFKYNSMVVKIAEQKASENK